MLEVSFDNVPPAAVPVLIEQLDQFGARFTLAAHRSDWSEFQHDSGRVRFRHEADTLHVRVVEDAGHFPHSMLIGGIRQMVEEAVEIVQHGSEKVVG